MQRVMIIGAPGSGKSTLAQKLGELTGLPVVHIDPMFWDRGWRQRSGDETRRMVLAAAAAERWIFEGNHSSTFDARAQRADLLIWLDLPTGVCLRRVLARTRRGYGKVRQSMPDGCPERFSPTFLFYVVTFGLRKRRKAAALIRRTHGLLQQVVLRSPREVEQWLETIGGLEAPL